MLVIVPVGSRDLRDRIQSGHVELMYLGTWGSPKAYRRKVGGRTGTRG